MCTLSWVYHGSNHYQVYFNRDEQRSRAPALEPQRFVIDGVHCVMPIDPVGGGSWITTNQYGVTLCLLNYYQGSLPQGVLTSRGLIVKRLASSAASEEVNSRLMAMDLSHFAPFTLVSFDTRRNANQTPVWLWDGVELHRTHGSAPITSAALHFDKAHHYRCQLFNHLIQHNSQLELGQQFHQTHDVSAPHLSPLMVRDDARTVSFTSVIVSSNQQKMIYQSIDEQLNIDFATQQSCLPAETIQQGVFK